VLTRQLILLLEVKGEELLVQVRGSVAAADLHVMLVT
jgi:hypothetical protein